MMKIYLLAASAVALLLSNTAPAQEGPAGGRGGMRQPPEFDLDHDGKVTRAEFVQVETRRIERMFGRMDANHDGKVTREELQAAFQRAAAARGGAGGQQAAARGDRFFARFDLNGDGAVTKAEMLKAAVQRFEAADTNHDGWLSKGELIMMRQRARGGGQ